MHNLGRGHWDVPTGSFHWRLYTRWRALGGKGPMSKNRPIDLCHYMRVVMIWVWFRKFFLGGWIMEIGDGELPLYPWLIVLVSGFIGGVTYLCVSYRDAVYFTLAVLAAFGIIVLAALIAVAIIFWEDRYPDSFYRFWSVVLTPFEYLVFGVWWVLVRIGHGFRALFFVITDGLFYATDRLLPYLERYLVWRIKYMHLLLILPLALPWLISNDVGLWLDVSVACLVALVAIFAGLVLLIDRKMMPWYNARLEARVAYVIAQSTTPKPAKLREPSAFTQFAKLLWMWLIAKKYRICPLITPQTGGDPGPTT